MSPAQSANRARPTQSQYLVWLHREHLNARTDLERFTVLFQQTVSRTVLFLDLLGDFDPKIYDSNDVSRQAEHVDWDHAEETLMQTSLCDHTCAE